MNKIKKFLIVFLSLFIIAYGLFFVLVYAFGNLNSYKETIQKTINETIGLKIDYSSAKLTPTPKVEIKLDIDNLNLSYPDSKKIASVDKFSLKVPILPIIAGNIKLSEIKIDKPAANFILTKEGDIDLIKYIEPYLSKGSLKKMKTKKRVYRNILKFRQTCLI